MTKLYNLLFIGLLALFSLGQLQRIQLTESIAIYIHDALIGGWVLSTVFFRQQEWRHFLTTIRNIHQRWIWGWLLWLLGTITLSTILHFSPSALLYIARTIVYVLFGCTLFFTVSYTKAQQRFLWVLAGLQVAWLGILQYLFIPNTRFLWILGWDDHYYRLISTQLDPNFTGILLVVTTYFMWSTKYLSQKLKIALSVPLLSAILLTYSRATYVSFLISLGLLAMLKLSVKKQLMILLVSLVCLGIMLLLPKPGGEGTNLFRTYSIKQRFMSSQRALKPLNTYEWVIGKGLFQPTNINPEPVLNQHAPFPDNLLVFLVVGLGLPGLALTLYVLLKATQYFFKTDRYLFAAWIAILVHSQFNHTLLQPFVSLILIGGVVSLQTKRHG